MRARQEGLAELSSVALWNRLRKSQAWLRSLCLELFRERGVELSEAGGLQVRALDATTVKEPGKTGSLWRVHYSVRLPSLACDFFRLTATKGTGHGGELHGSSRSRPAITCWQTGAIRRRGACGMWGRRAGW